MRLRDVQRLELPPTADMHVHLRQGKVMQLVARQVLNGGVDTVFVMPNLQPPITTVAQALEYQSALRSIEPRVQYLMSLYLHPSITPQVIAEAAAAGITGVKMYPQGVTTNSESGVPADFLSAYSPVFAAMQEHDLVLNLHGEWPGPLPNDDITLEEAFLPELKKLHERFPRLRCVLEWQRLRPHALSSKTQAKPVPAGVFTQPFATQLVLLAFEEAIARGVLSDDQVTQDNLEGFLSRSARRFYKVPDPSGVIVLERKGERVPTSIKTEGGDVEIGLSKAGAEVFSLSWK
ncbi:dihydroorotase, homodimeric type [Fonsecaea nubica]|uniref:Dihydroorotase, homodimeric type n=1 Tax=Fonsecaea nubica TaxID=856822 RepID=A0A178CC28_9EURO|nr:dihydroorotase, homodimeric type [Fonsecaea nubica]OAL26281.1 dihydroorotase, homodimeric type [Fonsecaea nubica]